MKTHDKCALPPEFHSGNNIPVERATVTRERMVEILTEAVEPYIETLFKIGEHLGINYQAARTAPGKPSDVYIAAIKADRQVRGEPVAWHSKQYGVVWMAIKPGNLVAGTQWFIQGRQEPVAEVVSPVSLVWYVATSGLEHGTVFYTAPQPQQIPPEQPYPDTYLAATWHEAKGWNDCRAAMLEAASEMKK